MIKVTRLDKSEILVNPDLIEHIELGRDAVITLVNGTTFVTKESGEEIVERIIEYRRKVLDRHPAFLLETAHHS